MQKEIWIVKYCLVALLLCGLSLSIRAEVNARVDRTIVSEYENITLTVTVTGSKQDTPDFSSILDFKVISQQQRSETSMSISGGKREILRVQIYSLILEPKRIGKLIIPELNVGMHVTEEIIINVVTPSAADLQRDARFAFFETKVDKTKAYVQSQIIYSVKLYYTNVVTGDFPSPPEIPETIIEVLENEIRNEAIVNGQRFSILEKRYAIFPQKSGYLTIPQEKFRGALGRGNFFSNTQTIAVRSNPITVEIMPTPKNFSGSAWIAAESFVLNETWSEYPPKFKVNEPVSRIISMTAKGLTRPQLPMLEELNLENAKTYVDPPVVDERFTKNGIISSNSTTIGIVPTQADPILLREIRIPWWNTRTNMEEVAIIPSRTYSVETTQNGQIFPIKTLSEPTLPEIDIKPQSNSMSWGLISLIIILTGYSLFASLQWLKMDKELAHLKVKNSNYPKETNESNEKAAFHKLKHACLNHNAADTHRFLALWGRTKFKTKSLQELQNRLQEHSFKDEVDKLERALYAKEKKSTWQGNNLLKLVTRLRTLMPEKIEETNLLTRINPDATAL